jgi:Gamma-glutamyl cyclotransferase, AIG2-like
MILFIWGLLEDRKRLSFILRRPYTEKFEPAILKGYMIGANYPDMLFGHDGSHYLAYVAHELEPEDIAKLDLYHAVGEDVHKRIIRRVDVMRAGNLVVVNAHVYVAGGSFSKITGGRLL